MQIRIDSKGIKNLKIKNFEIYIIMKMSGRGGENDGSKNPCGR